MANIGFEGFDDWINNESATSAAPFGTGITSQWVGGVLPKVAGQLGGGAVSSGGGSTPKLSLGVNYATIVYGIRIFTGAGLGAATQTLVEFIDGTTVQCGLAINTSKKLIAYTGTTATIKATGTAVLVPASYYYLEIKVTIDNTNGAMEVRLGGVADINASTIDTQTTANAFLNVINATTNSVNALSNIDDLYVNDTTGGAPHNDFYGIVRIETLFGTSADATAWTPNASTNVSRIQETSMDSDTTYNSSTVNGDVDTFNHGSLSSTPTTIFGTSIRAVGRKEDVSVQTLRTKLKSGVTTQNGASQSVATVYQRIQDVYLTDPNTGSAWITANVNSSKIGYEHV